MKNSQSMKSIIYLNIILKPNYLSWFLILPLCFSFFLFSISEYLFDKNHINFDNKINNQTVQVYFYQYLKFKILRK